VGLCCCGGGGGGGGGGIRPSLPECCLPLEVKLPFFSMVKVQFPSAKSVSAQVMWSIRRWHENAPEVVSESKFKVTYISLLSPLDNISKLNPAQSYRIF